MIQNGFSFKITKHTETKINNRTRKIQIEREKKQFNIYFIHSTNSNNEQQSAKKIEIKDK